MTDDVPLRMHSRPCPKQSRRVSWRWSRRLAASAALAAKPAAGCGPQDAGIGGDDEQEHDANGTRRPGGLGAVTLDLQRLMVDELAPALGSFRAGPAGGFPTRIAALLHTAHFFSG